MKKLALGLVLFTPSVFVSANDCYDSWYQRNLIFAERGYCFESNLGKEVFKGFECSTHSPKFSADEKKIIEQIKAKEHQLNCNINTALTKTNDSNVSSSSTEVIAKEVTGGISFKDLQLGMNKDAIPSKIKLVNGEKMYDFDKSFRFKVTDGNNNKIDIYGMSFDVSVIIRGDNNTVENITYTAKEAKNISETTLVELSKFFTSKSLKKRNLRYENGQLSNIVLEHTEINNGIQDDFRVIYNNENSTGSKNEVIVQLTLESADADEKRMKEAMDMAFGSH